ncbi:hypothetical protein KP79_PYT17204 [Mizuhopecten yessoensis]|uniref:Uncharacterized protein n=1 Tax=Mizuhopecten yessoensis TaxID=6573 RepID=A0A210PP76_MIZYE|nr:hypothetical protein KP79_PYT17204 [Mizuhopecten yessoensis]
MDKLNPKLRMLYPYSVLGKIRWFPNAHYLNNSSLLRMGLFTCVPFLVWSYYKIESVVKSPIGYGYLHKREDIYKRNKPFKTITEDMVQ